MPVNRKSTLSARQTQNAVQKSAEIGSTQQQVSAKSRVAGHPMFPVPPHLSSLSCLTLELALSLTAAVLQYLNLYQTVWWLPSSSQNSAVEFESIDCYLVWHICAMLTAPYIYSVLIELFSRYVLRFTILRSLLSVPLFISWLYLIFKPLLHVDFAHFSTFVYRLGAYTSFCYIPFLAVAIYHDDRIIRLVSAVQNLRIFPSYRYRTTPKGSPKSVINSIATNAAGLLIRTKQALLRCCWATADWPALTPASCLFPVRYMTRVSGRASVLRTGFDRFADLLPTAYYTMPPPSWDNKEEAVGDGANRLAGMVLLQHKCVGVTADQVRDEIELNRKDFNARLTDIFFGTLYSVYYSCILPILFVKPASLFYDSTWCLQHILTVTAVGFLLRWNRCVPPDYVDLLHRSCLHLGDWEPLESRHQGVGRPSNSSPIPGVAATVWSPMKIYPRGVVVRHLRGYYLSLGNTNAAEPGSSCQRRFYMLFHAPTQLSVTLLLTSVGLLAFLLGSLYWVFEWYKVLGLAANGSFALFSLYYGTRNYRLVRSVYATDRPQGTAHSGEPSKTADCGGGGVG